ncbi:hypothetical protein PCE1_004617 [Barthelona sp. PCE]
MEHQFIQFLRIFAFIPNSPTIHLTEIINGRREEKGNCPVGCLLTMVYHADASHQLIINRTTTVDVNNLLGGNFVDQATGLVVGAEFKSPNVDMLSFTTREPLDFVRSVNGSVPMLVFRASPGQQYKVHSDMLFGPDASSAGGVQTTIYRISNPTAQPVVADLYGLLDRTDIFSQIEQHIRKNIDEVLNEMHVEVSVAIDFTASNGNPTQPGTLHFGEQNDYTNALQALSVFEPYDLDKRIQMYGFGALMAGLRGVQHVFKLHQEPEGVPFDQLVPTYLAKKMNLRYSGPTLLAPVINAFCATMDTSKYNILVILLDGQINDVERVLQTVQTHINKPFSIVLVGIGKADFSAMHTLDGDGDKRVLTRDVIQFVEMNVFANQSYAITNEFFEELPSQCEEWYSTYRS